MILRMPATRKRAAMSQRPARNSVPFVVSSSVGDYALLRSQRRARRVVAEQPFVPRGDALPRPFALDVGARPGRIGKRLVVKSSDVVRRAFHRAPRTLAPGILIPEQARRNVAGTFREGS